MEIKNASRHAQPFYCCHMTPGLAGYNGKNYLVDTEAMKRMAASMVGKPIYIGHQKVDLEKLHEADGFVTDCFYNEVDGKLWAKCLAVSDAAHQAVKEKWDVSNAYMPTVTDKGGVYNGVDYVKKVLEGYFTHLAIVKEGRYNEAKIFTPEEFRKYQDEKKNELKELQNSKDKNNNGGFKMKFFKNKREEITNGADLDADTQVEIENGVTVSLGEMINAVKKASEDEKRNAKEKLNMDAEIECGDETMTVKELMNRYSKLKKNSKEKKNESEEDEDKKSKKDEKENEDEGKIAAKADGAKEEKENKNSASEELTAEEKKHLQKFRELQNAADKGKKTVIKPVDTRFDQIERGKQKYGSGK